MQIHKILKKTIVIICVRKLCNGFHNRHYFQIVIGLNLPWGAELVPNEKKLVSLNFYCLNAMTSNCGPLYMRVQSPGSIEIEQSYWLRTIKLDPWPLDEGPRPKKVANQG
jgi:hypothetical protein